VTIYWWSGLAFIAGFALAAYWYYRPLTDAEFLALFKAQNKRMPVAVYWTPGIVPAWAFLLAVIVKHRPRGRLMSVTGEVVAYQEWTTWPVRKREEKTFCYFWHPSYPEIGERDRVKRIVEV
jgi:hypothetical protein|tara:strand:+ start:2208 stop:2573 length:366 start_codon:yes stop_codon:yes gene_type:complete